MTAQCALVRSKFIDVGGGRFTYPFTLNGESGVLSVQAPDGSFGIRPPGTAGPWEAGTIQGDKFVLEDGAYPTGAFVCLVVD